MMPCRLSPSSPSLCWAWDLRRRKAAQGDTMKAMTRQKSMAALAPTGMGRM